MAAAPGLLREIEKMPSDPVGLKEEDIQAVMDLTGCSRELATKGLHYHLSDLAQCILVFRRALKKVVRATEI